MERYDFVSIGSGAAGMAAARTAAKAQARVAVIEKEQLGCDCLRYGCVPTKALVASARTSYLIRHAGDYGLSAQAQPVDLARVMARKNAVIAEVKQQETPETLRRQNVWTLFGRPRFRDATTLELDG